MTYKKLEGILKEMGFTRASFIERPGDSILEIHLPDMLTTEEYTHLEMNVRPMNLALMYWKLPFNGSF